MAPNANVYSGSMVSARSRRFRTIAAVLLAVVIAMAAYGIVMLMPGVKRSVETARQSAAAMRRAGAGQTAIGKNRLGVSKRDARIVRFKVVFAYAFWSVWMFFVLSLLLFVWLDLREVSRNYLANRRDLWAAASSSANFKELPEDTGASDPIESKSVRSGDNRSES